MEGIAALFMAAIIAGVLAAEFDMCCLYGRLSPLSKRAQRRREERFLAEIEA